MPDIVEDVLRFLAREDIEPDPFVFKLQTEQWRDGFWHGLDSYRSALAAYLERTDMTNKLTIQRVRAAELLSNAYAALRLVEHHLSDKEARLLIDIAQAIETIEEILDNDEEEQ